MARTKQTGKRRPKRPTQRQTRRNALVDGIRTYIKHYATEDYPLYKGLFDARELLKADEVRCPTDDSRSDTSSEQEWDEEASDKEDSSGPDPPDREGGAGAGAGAGSGGAGRRAVAEL